MSANIQPERLVQQVQEAIDRHTMAGFKLSVRPEGVRKLDGFWYVPVNTIREPSLLFKLYGLLAEIEEDLEQMGLDRVLLTTAA